MPFFFFLCIPLAVLTEGNSCLVRNCFKIREEAAIDKYNCEHNTEVTAFNL